MGGSEKRAPKVGIPVRTTKKRTMGQLPIGHGVAKDVILDSTPLRALLAKCCAKQQDMAGK